MIGEINDDGCEFSLSLGLTSSISFSGNYTYLDGKDTSPIPYYNGNELASTPTHEASLDLNFSRRRWGLGWKMHYIGSNFLDRANMEEVPGRNIHNIYLETKPFGDRFSIILEGRNLTDNQIRDVSGFPLPGRNFYLTMECKIEGGNDDSTK